MLCTLSEISNKVFTKKQFHKYFIPGTVLHTLILYKNITKYTKFLSKFNGSRPVWGHKESRKYPNVSLRKLKKIMYII